jgi:hypothetical protein
MIAKFQRSPAGGIGVACFLVCTGFGELSVLDIYMLSRTFKAKRQGEYGLNTWDIFIMRKLWSAGQAIRTLSPMPLKLSPAVSFIRQGSKHMFRKSALR